MRRRTSITRTADLIHLAPPATNSTPVRCSHMTHQLPLARSQCTNFRECKDDKHAGKAAPCSSKADIPQVSWRYTVAQCACLHPYEGRQSIPSSVACSCKRMDTAAVSAWVLASIHDYGSAVYVGSH
eukprot:6212559-Pleurochrysis_carterae.AAC.4